MSLVITGASISSKAFLVVTVVEEEDGITPILRWGR
jgi:hypothetical protein